MMPISLLTAALQLAFLLHQCIMPATTSRVNSQQPSPSLMDAGELDALFEVMDAMAGYTNWRMAHPHPCTDDVWPGLICEQGHDSLFHITRLSLGYKPNPSCASNASIPSAITKLPFLRSLFIFECFTSINTTIPTFLQKLAPTLLHLSLRANSALVGGIPPELAQLTSLELLSLSQNGLQGEIPTDLAKLSKLQQLDLSDNHLRGSLPPELGNLHSLVILDLSVNSLAGTIPPSLGNLGMLQKMDLSSNSVEGPLPQELGSLKALKFFAGNDNLITGPLPNSLSNWAALQYLILDNNRMNVPLPEFLGDLRSLMGLSLSKSGFYGPIPGQLGLLQNLTVLSLEGNNLTGKIPVSLGHLPRIYQLNLSQNSLSGPVPFTSEFAEKLGRNLELGGNLGLCAEWTIPRTLAASGLGLCSDPKFSAYVTNRGRSKPMPTVAKASLLSIPVILASC